MAVATYVKWPVFPIVILKSRAILCVWQFETLGGDFPEVVVVVSSKCRVTFLA